MKHESIESDNTLDKDMEKLQDRNLCKRISFFSCALQLCWVIRLNFLVWLPEESTTPEL